MAFVSLQAQAAIKVGLVLDKGGRDDRSFNQSAFEGGTRAEKELGIELKVVEATDDNAFEPALRSLARKKYDLVIGIGFAQMQAIEKVSKDYPDVKFAIVDSEVKGANVRSLMFEEHEGSFVVGALAAWKSKTGKIGFVGGMDIPLIRRFQMGYEAGAKYANAKVTVVSNYIGVTGTAWNNPARGKELALAQFKGGADITFAAAGASNLGVFDAAEEQKKLAIGVDSNQNWIKPGTIFTSMLKRVDVAVFEAIKSVKDGKFKAETARFGLGNGGIDYALDTHNAGVLPKDLQDKANALKAAIVAHKVKVPDYYVTPKAK